MPRSRPSIRPRIRRAGAAIATLAVVAALAVATGLPAGASTGRANAKASPDDVVVKGFRFRPAALEVAPGTKVVWRNRDQIEHTVTSADGAPAELDGALSRAGAKYAVRLTAPGTYEYFCARHPSMKARVIVG